MAIVKIGYRRYRAVLVSDGNKDAAKAIVSAWTEKCKRNGWRLDSKMAKNLLVKMIAEDRARYGLSIYCRDDE